MTEKTFIDHLKKTLQKSEVLELSAYFTAHSAYSMYDLIQLTFHPDKKIAFKAAWVMENVCIVSPEHFLNDIEEWIGGFPNQDNLSVRRHYTNILRHLTAKNAPQAIRQKFEKLNTTDLIETLFSWLIDEEVPVAVKANSIEILANFISYHPWIRQDLLEIIDFLMEQESIAFFARARRIKKQLLKQ